MQVIRQHFEIINSTNTWAKQYATDFARNAMTLVTADEQTAGRGRYNRHWVSPPYQNVYASFCFFEEKLTPAIGNIPQVLALSAVAALETLSFQLKLKWPNDILLNGKKLGGILCETTQCHDAICVIIGIGININMPLQDLQKISLPATSLFAETGKQFDVQQVISTLQDTFVQKLQLFKKEGFKPFLAEYRNFIAYSGQSISFHDNRQVWKGCLYSIQDDGSMNLQLDSGEIKNFIAGEILW